MTVQWESRGYTHELKVNWNGLTTRTSPKYSGVDLIIPGQLADEDATIDFKWIVTMSQVENEAGEVYASEPTVFSAVESDNQEEEELVKDLEGMLSKIALNLFPNWDAKVWQMAKPITRVLRFHYWYLFQLAGVIEGTPEGIVIEMRPEDFRYKRITNSKAPSPVKQKDLRVVIDQDIVHQLWNDRPSQRNQWRARPNWTQNCSDFNDTMDLITAEMINAIIPGTQQELPPDTQLDIIFGTYTTNETKKGYVDRGENYFKIQNNVIDALGTFTFELIAYKFEEKYKRKVWQVFRQGVASIHVKGGFKQVSPTVLRITAEPEFKNLIISNFKDEFTQEEDFIKAAI